MVAVGAPAPSSYDLSIPPPKHGLDDTTPPSPSVLQAKPLSKHPHPQGAGEKLDGLDSLPFKAQPLAQEVPSVLTGVVGFGCSLAAAFDMEMQYKAPPQKDTVGGYKAPPPEVADSGVDGSELTVSASETSFHAACLGAAASSLPSALAR